MLGPLTSRILMAQTKPRRENELLEILRATGPLQPKSFLDVRDTVLDLEPLSDNSAGLPKSALAKPEQ